MTLYSEKESEAVFALSLSLALNLRQINLYQKCYESYENILNLPQKEFTSTGILKKNRNFEGKDHLIQKAEIVKTRCKKLSIRWTTITDPDYPIALKETYLPPLVLYYKSEDHLPAYYLGDGKTYLSIVGTRRSDPFANELTRNTALKCTLRNGHIISGLALGIDSHAHIGACMGKQYQNSASNTAVLACGINHIYPPSNYSLYKKIIEVGGVILSEHPPDTRPAPYLFPLRNRIISGLSEGVFITQAPQKSGALITVNYALEQGRTIFAYQPKSGITNDGFLGNSKLIENGAIPISKTDDLFIQKNGSKKIFLKNYLPETEVVKSKKSENTIDDFLERLTSPKSFSELLEEIPINPLELNRIIMENLIKGNIKELPGNKFYTHFKI